MFYKTFLPESNTNVQDSGGLLSASKVVELLNDAEDRKIDLNQKEHEMPETQKDPPHIEKPPLGLIPTWQWVELRIVSINAAVICYYHANKPIPTEWWDELEWLAKELERLSNLPRTRKNTG